jgi:cytochrome c oxidase subunit 3
MEAGMAATATSTERAVKTVIGGGPRPRNGNGFHKNGGGDDTTFQFSPARYRIGIWMAIGSILMLFVALTSAYIVRSASSDDWHRIAMPKVLWLSTALLVVSSLTIELSRRPLAGQYRGAGNCLCRFANVRMASTGPAGSVPGEQSL